MKRGAKRGVCARSEEIKTCPPRDARARTPAEERSRGRQIGEIVVGVVASPSKLPRPKDATGFGGLCSAKCIRGQRERGRKRKRKTNKKDTVVVDERKEEGRIPWRNLTHG